MLRVPAAAPDDADAPDDTFLISLPSLHCEGLLFGSPFMELDGASYITSSTGYTAKIDYSGKGWLSGKKNSFIATLYPTGRDKEVLYNCAGQWTKAFEMHRGAAKHNSSSTLMDRWDPAATATTPLRVAPLEEQLPLESRRAWARVARGIQQGDMDAVGREKGIIENAQRAARRREQAQGREWDRRYFSAVVPPDDDAVLARLAPPAGLAPDGDADKTGGLWRFDPAKAQAARQHKPSPDEAAKMASDLLGQ